MGANLFAGLDGEGVRLTPSMQARLAAHPLQVIDVGAAFGPERRWSQLGETSCRFMAFEPDARSSGDLKLDASGRIATLAVALGSNAGMRTLHLTKAPFASSLCEPNRKVLEAFATWPWHEPAGEAKVKVDTLDHCLAANAGWRADFIKVDAEGADLEVLEGGRESLGQTLGVQVEVAFIERHVGAPLFSDIDAYLRRAGFSLYQLTREHWLRTNGTFGVNSSPQLVWADALYLRDRDWVLDALGSQPRSGGKDRQADADARDPSCLRPA